MANIKNPLLSLGAHGSLGKAVSFVERRGQKIAEKKPELPYFLTLPVQYQRWLYQDYTYLWTQQSLATKLIYQSAGVRRHLTGFQYWMKYQLTYLPDIAAWWKMDDNQGGTTVDSSRNANTATVIGASPARGRFDGCFRLDGLNDYLNGGVDPSIDLTDEFSLEFILTPDTITTDYCLFEKGLNNVSGVRVMQDSIGRIAIHTNQAAARQSTLTNIILSPLVDQHILITRSGIKVRVYHDGYEVTYALAGNHLDPAVTALPAIIGMRGNLISQPYAGKLDNWTIYTRELDAALALRHSLRRSPE